jgi:hypothetical protein
MGCGVNPRLNLHTIEGSLRAVQRDFPRINALLQNRRETMADEIVTNMVAGYRFVDQLIGDGGDPFRMGHLQWMLELNARVLCGTDPDQRRRHAAHLAATEEHFYADREGCIRDLVEWYELHQGVSVWRRAAGVYVHVLSAPQLFIEGNHRSGALIISRILGREGQPPFVLTVNNAKAYFDPSTLITKTNRRSVTVLFRMPKLKKHFASFLKQQADERYLLERQPACVKRA